MAPTFCAKHGKNDLVIALQSVEKAVLVVDPQHILRLFVIFYSRFAVYPMEPGDIFPDLVLVQFQERPRIAVQPVIYVMFPRY